MSVRTPRLVRILDRAAVIARQRHVSWVGTEHLIAAMAEEPELPADRDDLTRLLKRTFSDDRTSYWVSVGPIHIGRRPMISSTYETYVSRAFWRWF